MKTTLSVCPRYAGLNLPENNVERAVRFIPSAAFGEHPAADDLFRNLPEVGPGLKQ